MLQNVYTLPELIDLALVIPEVGCVNFNIIHTILHTIVRQLGLTDVRPLCRIDNLLLSKTELIRAKLKEAAHKRAPTPSENVGVIFQGHSIKASTSDKDHEISKKKEDTTPILTTQVASTKPSKELPEESPSTEKTPLFPTVSDTAIQTEDVESIASEIPPTETKKYEPEPEESVIFESKKHAVEKEEEYEMPREREPTPKAGKRQHTAEDYIKYINLENRVVAAEEMLRNHTDILDQLVEKIMKTEKRKKEGGPASEELEAMDERMLEIEEAMAKSAADHELLMDIDSSLSTIQKEFESVKALASLLEQMQLDISKKADKEETWAALATKGDLDLVNSKVDQLEFETAIEELGEAIGLLGLKFIRKNDEWEERAAELWRGIDSKMSRDIFEAAKVKIEARLTALMYGLRKLKKVVEDLLYPEASGVTRCILCRRPACISGMECLGISDSPKRRLSDKSSEDEDPNKLRETVNNVIAKKQKLDAPPYPKVKDTIFNLPYSSSSYRTSVDEKKEKEIPQVMLLPTVDNRESADLKKNSKIPKLPEINVPETSLRNNCFRPAVRKLNRAMQRARSKPRTQKAELVFTKMMLDKLERSEKEIPPPEKYRYTAVLEAEPPAKKSSRHSLAKSARRIEVTPEPGKTLDAFTPARLMTDTLRRDIIVSPTSRKGHGFGTTLSPSQFDTESNSS